MKFFLPNILLLSALLCPQVQAVDADGNFAIWGKGNKSCHSYNIARGTEQEELFKQYLMGYLTAFNIQLEATYRIAGKKSISDILGWLDDYCETKPVVSFEQSLADFIVEHHDQRLKKAPAKYGR